MTEAQLIEGCLRQERTAQRLLYDRYKAAMYTLAYRITGDFDEANTALQDTFVTVFRQLGQYRGEATLGAWVKAILVRKAYTQASKVKPLVPVEHLPEEAEPVDWYNDTIDSEYLEKAIVSLPEGARAVFVLIEVEGYAHREVAEMLHISEGTSKSQLNYAKKRLREMLKVSGL
jgi:RNA polymerase sigma factor (sigma-70 family)